MTPAPLDGPFPASRDLTDYWPGSDSIPAADIKDGLAVTRAPGGGWEVVHTWCWRNGGSGLPATGPSRCKRDAKTAMAELLATGCDFTASPDDIRTDPAWAAARKVGWRWGAGRSDAITIVPGLAPVCYASRNGDGTIHATNTIGVHVGDHHVHADDASFAGWRQNSPFEVEWLAGGADCTCGAAPGARSGPSSMTIEGD